MTRPAARVLVTVLVCLFLSTPAFAQTITFTSAPVPAPATQPDRPVYAAQWPHDARRAIDFGGGWAGLPAIRGPFGRLGYSQQMVGPTLAVAEIAFSHFAPGFRRGYNAVLAFGGFEIRHTGNPRFTIFGRLQGGLVHSGGSGFDGAGETKLAWQPGGGVDIVLKPDEGLLVRARGDVTVTGLNRRDSGFALTGAIVLAIP